VSPAVAVGFKVTGLGPFTAPGAVGTATVTAVDALGGTITTYSGTVHFTSTDADATLPANYSYVAGDAGVHAFSVTLNTAGTWTVTATDTTTSSITGSETGIVVQDAIWILNGNMELERLSDAGSTLNQTSVTGTASSAGSVAFDNTGNVWVVGNANNDVYVYSHIGTTISSGFSGGGINTPTAIAIDGLGDAWIANGNGSISQLASPSGAVTPSTGYQSDTGLLKTPTGLIIDNAGSVWVTNSGNNTVTKIIGVAAPVTTPTVTGTTNNTLGVRP
jgi:streptogramin lyase